MSQVSEPAVAAEQLQEMAHAHLMFHFTDMAAYRKRHIPILNRGAGCYLFDDQGNRYIDGMSGLFCANLGHSHGEEIGEAARRQMGTLPYATNWTAAHPPSVELAARLASLAPSTLNRVFFASGGSEAVESAWKMALQYHQTNGEPQRRKAIARVDSYHGSTMGALSFTGMPMCRSAFEPMPIPVLRVANTNSYRHPDSEDPAKFCKGLLDEIEAGIAAEGAETIAMLIAEPVQNAGGSLVPPPGYWQGLREICDRHGILLCSDEVICAFGRLGSWFGAEHFDFQPDLLTFAKGLTGGHFPMGGVLIADQVAEKFVGGTEYLHGFTFGGHPVGSVVAQTALDIYEREGLLGNVRSNEPIALAEFEALRDIPIVGDIRGMGHFWSVEIVKDQDTKEGLTGAHADWLMTNVLSEELWNRGLICRLDSRADPVVQLAPPLVGGPELFAEITAILREGLEIVAERIDDPVPSS